MRAEAILFDLDGTLLDTLADIGASANAALRGLNLPTHELDAYRYYVGEGVQTLFRRALPPSQADDRSVQRCVQAFREEYSKGWNIESRLYPGIAELLDELSGRSLRLAVLSNKPDEFTRKCVQHYLSAWRFDAVFGQREAVPRKPDPAAALEIAQLLGVRAAECLFVGDTSVDMRTATAAGMPSVGVLWGFRPRKELEEAGAQHLIGHPNELLALLDR